LQFLDHRQEKVFADLTRATEDEQAVGGDTQSEPVCSKTLRGEE
jgi:hypothetical protein